MFVNQFIVSVIFQTNYYFNGNIFPCKASTIVQNTLICSVTRFYFAPFSHQDVLDMQIYDTRSLFSLFKHWG